MPTRTKLQNPAIVGSGDPDSTQLSHLNRFRHWCPSFGNNGYPPSKSTTQNQNLFHFNGRPFYNFIIFERFDSKMIKSGQNVLQFGRGWHWSILKKKLAVNGFSILVQDIRYLFKIYLVIFLTPYFQGALPENNVHVVVSFATRFKLS